jgi:hypothetical protein
LVNSHKWIGKNLLNRPAITDGEVYSKINNSGKKSEKMISALFFLKNSRSPGTKGRLWPDIQNPQVKSTTSHSHPKILPSAHLFPFQTKKYPVLGIF